MEDSLVFSPILLPSFDFSFSFYQYPGWTFFNDLNRIDVKAQPERDKNLNVLIWYNTPRHIDRTVVFLSNQVRAFLTTAHFCSQTRKRSGMERCLSCQGALSQQLGVARTAVGRSPC